MIIQSTDLDSFFFLPSEPVTLTNDALMPWYAELIDDETQEITTLNGGIKSFKDFVKVNGGSTLLNLPTEKYYTLRIKTNSADRVVYRDKIFRTTQSTGVKYDNNKDQYIKADTGNNDYILL